jgi:hypothetical protein
MKCPFKKYLGGTLVCDYMSVNHENVFQCPTEIFNKCQADNETLNDKDQLIINETLQKLKCE